MLAPAAARAETIVEAKPAVSATDPGEALRLQLFKGSVETANCQLLKTDPRGQIIGQVGDTAALQQTVSALIAAVRAKHSKELQPLFHTRLNVSLAALDEIFGKLEFTYGSPFDVSIYRLWALNTVDGSAKGLDCPGDLIKVYPQYGYNLQMGLWLQVMGQKEIGRIYASLVPTTAGWVIGAFHVQQWTHAGKDYAEWADLGAKALRQSFKESAYIKYDLAAKLTDGGPFVELGERPELIKARDAVLSYAQWDQLVKAAVKGHEVVHTATILVPGGDGMMLRLRVPKELSLEDMTKDCKGVALDLAKLAWTAEISGVRCSYLLPKEDPKKDGAMGSLYTELRPGPVKR